MFLRTTGPTRYHYKDSETEDELHRLDGPAIEWEDGANEWWVDGKRHRLDGPAVEDRYKSTEWWVNGKKHRVDGPAVVRSDIKHEEWWFKGKRHRLDGPAVVRNSFLGSRWFLFDIPVSENRFHSFVQIIHEHLEEQDIRMIPYEILEHLYAATYKHV